MVASPITLPDKSLGLEETVDSDDLISEHPRRLVLLDGEAEGESLILAFGGEDGHIAAARGNSSGTTTSFEIVQRYDDEVRAVAVSPDAKRIAVGLDDGSTTIYNFDDYDVNANELHPFCQALESKHKNNNDNDTLLSQDFAKSSLESFAGPQFELPVRDLKFVPRTNDKEQPEYWLAIASESGACLVNVTDTTTVSQRELEHSVREQHAHAGIRGLATHQHYLATLAMDGLLCLWNAQTGALVQKEDSKCIPKKDVGEVHGADAWDRSCRPIFANSSNDKLLLMTPGRLLPYVREWQPTESNWNLVNVSVGTDQEEQGHVESIVCIKILPALNSTTPDRALVTAGRDGRLILWKFTQEEEDGIVLSPLQTFVLPSPATDVMVLADKDNLQVLAACAKGTYVTLDVQSHLPKDMKSPSAPAKVVPTKTAELTQAALADSDSDDDEDTFKEETPSKETTKKTILKKTSQLEEDSDDDVDFGASSSPASKSRVSFVLDDEAEEDDTHDKEEDQNKSNKTSDATSKDNEKDEKDDDEDSLADEPSTKKTLDNLDAAMDDLDGDDEPEYLAPATTHAMIPTIPPQPAFSPASTPLDLTRRYLCWNHLGAVTLLQGDDRNTVDISFTDAAYKRPISFTDNMNFIVGSLGDDGAIFATDLQNQEDEYGDEDMDDLDDLNISETTKRAFRKSKKKNTTNKPTGSALFFYRFDTFGNLREKDWFMNLPDGEQALGVATGAGWAAAMTSRKFLRFFSSGGNQGQVVWLKGDPVTMVGRGRFLAVLYHDRAPLSDGTQQLACTLWDATSFQVLYEGPLSCLSREASVTWLGFSNDCSLMAMDSNGMLSMLVQAGSQSWAWVPVLDTLGLRKSKDDQFWPVTVYDGKLVCVPLKGGTTYPDASRRPVTSTLGLRLPLAAAPVAKTSILEEVSVRSNLALEQKRFVQELEGSDDTEQLEREFLTMTAQVDKVTLKLFAAMVDANKQERALDLVDRLHLEKSYDLAVQLSGQYHKLADLIEEAKFRKFAPAEEEFAEEDYEDDVQQTPDTTFMDRLASSSRQISPENQGLAKLKRSEASGRHTGDAFSLVKRKKSRLE